MNETLLTEFQENRFQICCIYDDYGIPRYIAVRKKCRTLFNTLLQLLMLHMTG